MAIYYTTFCTNNSDNYFTWLHWIIDLEELWPQKSISDRLGAFLEELQEKIMEKEKKDKWFEWGEVNISYNANFVLIIIVLALKIL